jgi:hypothetical protein
VREGDDLALHLADRRVDEIEWPDPNDALPAWIDIERVSFSSGRYRSNDYIQPHWQIELAAEPPRAARLEPGRLIAYGLVLDTTGDGAADYLIGIDNDTPNPGDFHVWVTALATGQTDVQIGPPYGFPIEFGHPDEQGTGPTVTLTFLPLSAPEDLDVRTVRFYAWASVTRDGEVLAWDLAPDDGWMTRP